MSEYRRTAIRRLSVRRYRSLRDVVLDDLPEVIVFYGKSGTGKSNLLRAVQLALRAAALPGALPTNRDEAVAMPLPEADRALSLRPDDFRFGDLPEIRISVEIDLGTRAREIIRPPSGRELSRLELEAVFQLPDNRVTRFWFERAHIDGSLSLGRPSEAQRRLALQLIEEVRDRRAELIAERDDAVRSLDRAEAQDASSESITHQLRLRAKIRDLTQDLKQADEKLLRLEGALEEDLFVAERVRRYLLPQLLQTSDAYRVPGGTGDPQSILYQAFLSEDPVKRSAAHRLGQRLARAGLFGAEGQAVAVLPVDSRTYAEKQIRFHHPMHGDLSLRNLGSGEQQVVLMIAQRVITPSPIALIEEPEAHLHKTLMEPLARVLSESVHGDGGTPDVDQLWMATHHHLFAIANEFFDVSLGEDGSTIVSRRKREEAAVHFYEPSPYWDTLRGLVESGMSPDTVVSLDEVGKPIRAKDVLDSIQGDRRIANEFVRAATKAFVLSLARDETAK